MAFVVALRLRLCNAFINKSLGLVVDLLLDALLLPVIILILALFLTSFHQFLVLAQALIVQLLQALFLALGAEFLRRLVSALCSRLASVKVRSTISFATVLAIALLGVSVTFM